MYPLLRLALETWRVRRMPPLGVLDTHVSHHRIWPWDLDPWVELNNGRTLTLYDLGRVPMVLRSGLIAALRRRGWGITVAGSCPRYRRRLRLWDRVQMRSRLVGWDDRFLYVEQAMWKGADCANHVLIRTAVTGPAGIVPPAQVLAAMGAPTESPPLPDWIRAWIAAEAQRPWPPAV